MGKVDAGLAGVYDAVASEYAERLFDELSHKPFDRLVLDAFVEKLRGAGPVADVGCGPGQVARYLADHGASDVLGVDVSPGMVAEAARRSPDLTFHLADFLDLPYPDGAWAGAAAFYSIVHLPTHALAGPFLELGRVVRAGGLLQLGFHLGHGVRDVQDWWGKGVDARFYFHDRGAVAALLRASGWRVIDALERPPYAESVEYPSRRAYLLAVRDERLLAVRPVAEG